MTNELMTIETVVALKGKKAIDVLSCPAKLKPLVDHVRKEALSVQFDVNTSKGRKEVGTAANNVVQSRKPIIEAIDKHISDHQQVVSGLKEAKGYVENEFKLIKGEVLKPRQEWQTEQDRIEKERLDGIRARIDNLRAIGTLTGDEDRTHIESLIEALEAQDLSTGFDELTQEAMQTRQEVIKHLSDRIMQIIEESNARKQAIESSINAMKAKVADMFDAPRATIQAAFEEVCNLTIDDSYGDRKEEAETVKLATQKKLSKLIEMADDEEEPLPFVDNLISEEDEAIFNDCIADKPDRVSHSAPVENHDNDVLAHEICEYAEGVLTLEQAHHIIAMVNSHQ